MDLRREIVLAENANGVELWPIEGGSSAEHTLLHMSTLRAGYVSTREVVWENNATSTHNGGKLKQDSAAGYMWANTTGYDIETVFEWVYVVNSDLGGNTHFVGFTDRNRHSHDIVPHNQAFFLKVTATASQDNIYRVYTSGTTFVDEVIDTGVRYQAGTKIKFAIDENRVVRLYIDDGNGYVLKSSNNTHTLITATTFYGKATDNTDAYHDNLSFDVTLKVTSVFDIARIFVVPAAELREDRNLGIGEILALNGGFLYNISDMFSAFTNAEIIEYYIDTGLNIDELYYGGYVPGATAAEYKDAGASLLDMLRLESPGFPAITTTRNSPHYSGADPNQGRGLSAYRMTWNGGFKYMNEFEKNGQLLDAGWTTEEIVEAYESGAYEKFYAIRYGWREHQFQFGGSTVYPSVGDYMNDHLLRNPLTLVYADPIAYNPTTDSYQVAFNVNAYVFNGEQYSQPWGDSSDLGERFDSFNGV